jgi:hypothetical protein
MWIIGLLVLIALGLLGVASWLAAKQPGMSGPLKQLQGIEGWVGVIGLVWGVIGLLQWLQALSLLSVAPVMVLVALVSVLVILALSLILALPLLKSWMGGGGATDALSNLSARLAPYKMILGFVCLGLAAYTLVRMVM